MKVKNQVQIQQSDINHLVLKVKADQEMDVRKEVLIEQDLQQTKEASKVNIRDQRPRNQGLVVIQEKQDPELRSQEGLVEKHSLSDLEKMLIHCNYYMYIANYSITFVASIIVLS